MKHLPFAPTQVTPLPYYSRKLGVELSCKRDDLFPEAGGGNKARMLQYILAEVSPQNTDVLLTAGGPCSNFNRACALMCAKLGIAMHLIEYTDREDEFKHSLNYFLCKLANVRTTRCDKKCVADTIAEVKRHYENQGLRVKLVYGGGKSLEGVYAYYDAVRELREQQQRIDALFVACGTGTTLAGLCAGMHRYFPEARIHAISTARSYEQELLVLQEDMSMLNDYLGSSYSFSNMKFYEDYLCGGYGGHGYELMATIRDCASHEGMLIDPTYSGKAFWGMCDIIQRLNTGKHILFWNTGGLMNLLAAAPEVTAPNSTSHGHD